MFNLINMTLNQNMVMTCYIIEEFEENNNDRFNNRRCLHKESWKFMQ